MPDEALPAPLVPVEVDLTDFDYMPLYVTRLLKSEFWIAAVEDDPQVAAVSVNLWATAWHEVPAGSLPDSDVSLARAAGVPRKVWLEIRERVLAQWVRCSDGRWYHPVVSEKALEAWAERQRYRARTQDFSERQSAKAKARWKRKSGGSATNPDAVALPRHTSADATALPRHTGADATALPRHTHGNAEPMPMKVEGEGEGERKKISVMSEAGASDLTDGVLPLDLPAQPPPDPEPSEGYTAEFEAWWKLYPRKDAKGSAFKAFQKAKTRAKVSRIMDGVAAYARRRKGEDPQFTKLPTTWLNGDCWNDEPEQKPIPKTSRAASNGGFL